MLGSLSDTFGEDFRTPGTPEYATRVHFGSWEPAAVLSDLEAKRALLDDLIAEKHAKLLSGDTDLIRDAECCAVRWPGHVCTCDRDARVLRRLVILCRPFMTRDDFPTEALPEVPW